jgi:hypothetical protein
MHDKDMMPVFVVLDGMGNPVEVFEDEHEAKLFAVMHSASKHSYSAEVYSVVQRDLHFKDRSRNAEASSYYL